MSTSKGKRQAAFDHVDRIVEEWRAERPDLDMAPLRIVGRLGRLMVYIDAGLQKVFAEYGISRATWDVIAALRRAGPPYKLGQSQLLEALMRTSGTISVRIERLVRDGLVTREPGRGDRRSVLITLTPKGLALFDRVARKHLQNEARLVTALSKTEQTELAGLLRKLLLSFESSDR